MKAFYLSLALFYSLFLWWYGGFAPPVTDNEVDAFVQDALDNAKKSGADPKDLVKYMHSLAKSDKGGEFLMVNLMNYRDKAQYPADSPWANDRDARAADARYGEKIIPLLLKRAGHPVLVGPIDGHFIIEGVWGNWDDVGIIRYRSVRDMMEMLVEMTALGDVAVHKWASMETTQVFPIRSIMGMPGPRFILGAILLIIALGVTVLRSPKHTS